MLKFIRYAIAALFFAASVGCLALWVWSCWHSSDRLVVQHTHMANAPFVTVSELLEVKSSGIAVLIPRGGFVGSYYRTYIDELSNIPNPHLDRNWRGQGLFYIFRTVAYTEYRFPLWYASLVFALAGVGDLRFRRQFSIKSALIATCVVAALLGMVVTL